MIGDGLLGDFISSVQVSILCEVFIPSINTFPEITKLFLKALYTVFLIHSLNS